MSKIIPLSLRGSYSLVRNSIKEVSIIDIADEIVHDDMTMNQLINKVSVALLHRDDINSINDESVEFRRNLLEYIEEIIGDRYSTELKEIKYFDKNGNLVITSHPHIIGEKDKPEFSKNLFYEAIEPETFVRLKGSEKKLDNNSEYILNLYSTVQNRVREDVDEDILRLYSVLEYERNKNKVSESPMEYRDRMLQLADETALYRGYVFADTRKFDSSSRDYPLSRFGHAFQYGDSFQKWLIQPELGYTVTKEDIEATKQYIMSEFGVKSWYQLYKKSIKLVDENIELMNNQWNNGVKTDFTIDGKELGKCMQVISLVNNTIRNENGFSRELICLDFTNSGGVMYANQYGDEKLCRVANLIGGSKNDSHQMVANHLGVTRNEAKKVMQPFNHGARLKPEYTDMINAIFGESYKGINAFAEYGKKLLMNGVKRVEMIAPDGVKGYFYGYEIGAQMSINETKVNLIAPFSKNDLGGSKKGYGMGVKPMHMSDAYVVRHIRRKLIKANIGHLTILDAFYIRPATKNIVANMAYEALENLNGWCDSEITRIERLTGIEMDNRPKPRSVKIEKTGNIF
jgi:hypothetical protein